MRIKYIYWGMFLFSLTFSMCAKEKIKITTSSPEALKLYEEGVKLAEKFYDQEAIEKFQQAIKLDTTFVMAYYYLSRSQESLGNLAKAKEAIEKAAKYSGVTTPLEWMYVAAWQKILHQNYAGAVKVLKDILKDYPNNRHAMFVLGKTYFLMNRYEDAIKILNKLVELNPLYAPAYNQLGYNYRELGENEKALNAFKKYAELAPDEPNPHDSLGDMYRAQGEYEKAIEEYKKSLEAKPDFYTSYRNLGLSYLAFGEYDKAIDTYDEFLKRFTGRERKRDAYSDLVQVYLAKGQYNKALEYADKAYKFSESNFWKAVTIAMKGQIYYLKDDFRNALKELNAALTIFPESMEAREGRGWVFVKQKKFGEALAEAEKMKILIEKYGIEGYQSNYNSLMGRIAMAQGFYDEAIMYFKDAMKYDIFDLVSNRHCMARAYFYKRDYDKAIEICKQIFKYNKNHALTHLLLARIYEKQFKGELATAEYNKFFEIWKNADSDIPELVAVKKSIY